MKREHQLIPNDKRWCGNCMSIQPKALGNLIPLPNDPLRGVWHCYRCLCFKAQSK